MEHWLYKDGTTTKYRTDNRTLFVWQRMRTKGLELLRATQHIERLNRSALSLFGISTTLSTKELQDICRRLLIRGNYSSTATHIVELRLDSVGDISLRVIETSLYKDFALRVVRPKAYITECSAQLLESNTSASLVIADILRAEANNKDCAIAICTNSHGEIKYIDGASPIIVRGKEITISPTIDTLDTVIAIDALKQLNGMELTIAPIMVDLLSTATELLYVDSRGVTSVSQVGDRFYADSTAYALSKAIKW